MNRWTRADATKRGQIEALVQQTMKVDLASSARSIAPPKDTSVWDASGSLASAGIDKNFVIDAANVLQTLLCLSHLASADADDSSKGRVYANLANEKLQALSELMRPMLWNLGSETANCADN
jgi:hypothetical protein